MSGQSGSQPVRPAYVATPYGQVRYWRAGEGRPVVVLPGLILGAGVRARQWADALAGHMVISFELPGIGGSEFAGTGAGDAVAEAASVLAAAWRRLGLGNAPIVAFDLTAPIASALARELGGEPAAVLAIDQARARAWAARNWRAPDLAPRGDGCHLTALWARLRDAHVLIADNPILPARDGEPLPSPRDLDETVVAAASSPRRFETLWNAAIAAMAGSTASGAAGIESIEAAALAQRLEAVPAQMVPVAMPVDAARPETRTQDTIWCDYVDIAHGRVHLRRAGQAGGRPLLMFQSAPGSTAPLAEIIAGLAPGRDVVAPDFLGNGRSDKPAYTRTDVAALARDGLAVAEALGFEEFDVWGTHTGACVALELAILAPERVGRAVLEAPPLLPPSFTEDILANYLPPLRPDRWGLHLQQAWNMRRDMFLFWPWYADRRDAVRNLGVPDAQFLHDWTVGLLSSGETYDRSYRSAFEYDTQARLPLLKRPAMICAGPADMLVEGLEVARRISPEGTVITPLPATIWYPRQSPEGVARTLAAYDAFLKGEYSA